MIYLVTDSTAYLTRQEASQPEGPGGAHGLYQGGQRGLPGGLCGGLAAGIQPGAWQAIPPAQAPGMAFLDLFTRLKAQGHQALCITISSRLSGTFANALKAAEDTGECIQVIDSRTTAGAQYLLLRAAREMLDQGMGLMECFEALKQMRGRSHTIFTIQDMDPLRRSGRLGYVRSSVSTLLNLRPLLTLSDGSVVSHSLARGSQDVQRLMALSLTGNPQEVIVQHCADEDSASSWRSACGPRGKR